MKRGGGLQMQNKIEGFGNWREEKAAAAAAMWRRSEGRKGKA
jgi:hypothetical protein